MKKSLIAGAASLAIAAMPVVGVFAETTQSDSLEVTVESSCSITRAGSYVYKNTATLGSSVNLVGYNNASPSTTTGTNSSTYTITCNDSAGYSVAALMTKLEGTNTNGDMFNYGTSAAGNWTATTTNTVNGTAASAAVVSATLIESGDNTGKYSGTLISSDTYTPAAGDTAVVSYAAYARSNQATGTYTGTATYTLSGNGNASN